MKKIKSNVEVFALIICALLLIGDFTYKKFIGGEFDIDKCEGKQLLSYIMNLGYDFKLVYADKKLTENEPYKIRLAIKNDEDKVNIINKTAEAVDRFFEDNKNDLFYKKKVVISVCHMSQKTIASFCNYDDKTDELIGGFHNLINLDGSEFRMSSLNMFSNIRYINYFCYKNNQKNIFDDLKELCLPEKCERLSIYFMRVEESDASEYTLSQQQEILQKQFPQFKVESDDSCVTVIP